MTIKKSPYNPEYVAIRDNVLEVWDFETSSKNRMHNKIKEILYVCNKTMV